MAPFSSTFKNINQAYCDSKTTVKKFIFVNIACSTQPITRSQ